MKILLHICCGVCAGSVVEKLRLEGHHVTGYFFNPNIHPAEEYDKRLQVSIAVCNSFQVPLIAGEYRVTTWHNAVKGFEDEPEGGRRCEICYRVRLMKTFNYMQQHDFYGYTTTLTVSPHKPASIVNKVGNDIGGDKFLRRDFKKQDGFKRANEIARKLDIYRQHYCGCMYSLNNPPHVH